LEKEKQFDNLAAGQQVKYTLAEGGDNGKGPRAASVKPLR
jgi:cold shock CspA family protein